jgi:hypothetical protein
MQGIVYLSFKESLNEIRAEIVKELEAAGYEIAEKRHYHLSAGFLRHCIGFYTPLAEAK